MTKMLHICSNGCENNNVEMDRALWESHRHYHDGLCPECGCPVTSRGPLLQSKKGDKTMLTVADAEKRLEQAKKNQAQYYSVMADGNKHHIGKKVVTKKETITVAKCKKIVETIQGQIGVGIEKIQIFMTQWDYEGLTPEDYLLVLSGDIGVPKKGKKRNAYYFVKSNTLRIWEDGMPVYENANGVITRDADALADCLM